MHACGIENETLLMTLLPRVGPRAAMAPFGAVLKWADTDPLFVMNSEIEFSDSERRVLGRFGQAFGLEPGMRIEAPYSQWLIEERSPPQGATLYRWRLNEWMVMASLREPESVWSSLCITHLPLLLPSPDDRHVIAGLVNLGDDPIDIAQGVQEAVLWVDGKGWPSMAGRVWNGPYLLRQGHTTMRGFRPSDFPGAPTEGVHEVSLEMAGRRSLTQIVYWHGSPWPES